MSAPNQSLTAYISLTNLELIWRVGLLFVEGGDERMVVVEDEEGTQAAIPMLYVIDQMCVYGLSACVG